MLLLAASEAWVAVVASAVGGLIGFMTSWLVQRSERADRTAERADRTAERLRTERREAYAALLTRAEDSMHLFQWLAEGHSGPAGIEGDKAEADTFYDREVTPRYRLLKIIGTPKMVEAGRDAPGGERCPPPDEGR